MNIHPNITYPFFRILADVTAPHATKKVIPPTHNL
jgi:hypothetical protein